MKYSISTMFLFFALVISAVAQKADTKFTKEDLQKVSVETVKLFQQKKYGEASSPAKKAVEIARELYGKKHIETAKNLRNLGYIQLLTNQKKEAKETFEEMFEIYEQLPDLNKEDIDFAAGAAEILADMKSQVTLKSAEKYYQQALIWREEGHGKDSPKILNALVGLANINYWDKDYNRSAEFYKRAIEIGSTDKSLDKTEYYGTFLRGQCAYRKAKKSDEFETIKEKFSPLGKSEDLEVKGTTGTKTISGGTVNGKATNLPKPDYPIEARRSGGQGKGKVEVEILINENGNVISACAKENDSIHPSLLISTEIAAYSAKFEPTSLKGKPVNVFGIITYIFN